MLNISTAATLGQRELVVLGHEVPGTTFIFCKIAYIVAVTQLKYNYEIKQKLNTNKDQCHMVQIKFGNPSNKNLVLYTSSVVCLLTGHHQEVHSFHSWDAI